MTIAIALCRATLTNTYKNNDVQVDRNPGLKVQARTWTWNINIQHQNRLEQLCQAVLDKYCTVIGRAA